MNYSFLDFLTLLGAVGMFLYGMKVMSEGLQKIAGDRMRSILSAMTKNRFAGVITGVLITALIQSSSASTVMVVSFVNAGLMTLGESMAVIMGANVGTTATTWIISLLGVKVNISAVAIPLIAFATPMLFMQKNKWKSTGEFLIGFAFLFLGLEYLSNSVPDLQANPELFAFLQSYTNSGFLSVLIFLIVGIVVTMVIQSSAATFAIVMIMCTKGWISFPLGCAMVLGSNIGTTITPILASFGGNVAAKKAALGHLMFNVLGTAWTLILFFPFVSLIEYIVDSFGQGDPNALLAKVTYAGSAENLATEELASLQASVAFGLTMFHTMFNFINLTVMIWLTETYVKICNWMIKSKTTEDAEFQLKYISGGLLSASELNITQAEREIALYGERVNRMWGMVKDLKTINPGSEEFNKLYSRIEKYEEISDRMEIEIANYLKLVSGGRLSFEGKLRISALLNIISEIESIADSNFNIARTIVRQDHAHIKFNDVITHNINSMEHYIDEALENMLKILRDIEGAQESLLIYNINKEREINNYRNTLRCENIENINNRLYEYQEGIFYMDIINECEKLGDYVINVIEDVKNQLRHKSELNTHES